MATGHSFAFPTLDPDKHFGEHLLDFAELELAVDEKANKIEVLKTRNRGLEEERDYWQRRANLAEKSNGEHQKTIVELNGCLEVEKQLRHEMVCRRCTKLVFDAQGDFGNR